MYNIVLISHVLVTQDMAYHGDLSFNLLMTDADVTTASIQHIETKEETSRKRETVGMSVTVWHFSVLTS